MEIDMEHKSTLPRDLYVNASVVIAGAVCTVLLVIHIVARLSPWGGPSVLPGWRFLASLCYPILYGWIGMLLRAWTPHVKWWVQVLVAVSSGVMLWLSLTIGGNVGYVGALYIAMAGVGFLVPPESIRVASQDKGWMALVMVMLSAFCYTAVDVARDSLVMDATMPNYLNMEGVLQDVLSIAIPFLAMITTWEVVRFSFSRMAQKIGSQQWLRWVVFIPCLITFVGTIVNLVKWPSDYMVRNIYYSPRMALFAQPVLVGAVVWCLRWIRKNMEIRRKSK